MEKSIDSAKKYHRIKNWLLLTNIVLILGGLFLLLLSGLSLGIKNRILEFSQNNFLVVAIYIFIIDIGYFIISFPLNFYEGYGLEHRFGLSRQGFIGWFKDLCKKQIIEFLILLLTVEALYIFLKNATGNWWVYTAIFWIFLSIVLAKITPNIIIPLFFKTSPIKNDILKAKIVSLVDKSGAAIKNIFVIDFSAKTKKSNALISGLGKNRRILLADNLIAEFNPDQIGVVVAHELAHELYKDTIRLLIFGGAFSFLVFFSCDIFLKSAIDIFGFEHIHDVAAFPLLALSLFIASLLILPLQNSYSRRRERKADLFALNLTQDVDSFISMMKKLGKKNLADFSPNKAIEFLLYNHPPIAKRIAQANKFYKGEERRRYIRLDTVLPVEFQVSLVGLSGAQVISPWQQGFTQDVSYGGICLKVNFLKQNISYFDITKIKIFLNIHLPARRRSIYAKARCAWIKKVPETEDSYILGLNFETMREKDRQILLRYARYRKFLPRLIFTIITVLFITLLIVQTYNFKLELKNQQLVSDLTGIVQELSITKGHAQRIDAQRDTLDRQLLAKDREIRQLNKRLSEIALKGQKASLKYQKELEEQGVRREIEIDRLKIELDKLGKEKRALEDKLINLAKRQKEASSIIVKAQQRKLSMEKETLKKMYAWVKARQNSKTGLIASFEGDKTIEDWAFVYDQALAALVFTISDDYARAEKIFDFYKKVSLGEDAFAPLEMSVEDKTSALSGSSITGFANAYYASGGEVSEYVVHSGPNIWLGISILQYTYKTRDRRYLFLAEHIARWLMDLQSQDKDGGIRGGLEVNWYATEHNLDAYAFFNMLYKITQKPEYLASKDKVLSWLRTNAYNKGDVPIWRGKGDSTIATDTYFWSIAALGPEKLKSIGMDPDKIIKFAEDNCYVSVDFLKPNYGSVRISGFDFARIRHSPRGGIVSSEFTAQVVVSYKIMSTYYKKNNDQQKARIYEVKAHDLLNELEKMIILSVSMTGQSFPCLPYATQENTDTGHGWLTPKGKQTGSLSGTIYTIFGYNGFNPLAFTPLEMSE